MHDPNPEVAAFVEAIDEPDEDDPVERRIAVFVEQAGKRVARREQECVNLFLQATYFGVEEAIVRSDRQQAARRGKLFKCIVRISKKKGIPYLVIDRKPKHSDVSAELDLRLPLSAQ